MDDLGWRWKYKTLKNQKYGFSISDIFFFVKYDMYMTVLALVINNWDVGLNGISGGFKAPSNI